MSTMLSPSHGWRSQSAGSKEKLRSVESSACLALQVQTNGHKQSEDTARVFTPSEGEQLHGPRTRQPREKFVPCSVCTHVRHSATRQQPRRCRSGSSMQQRGSAKRPRRARSQCVTFAAALAAVCVLLSLPPALSRVQTVQMARRSDLQDETAHTGAQQIITARNAPLCLGRAQLCTHCASARP